MWLIWIIIAGGIVYLFSNQSKTNAKVKGSTIEHPEDIIKKRYARGEITKEEYEELKRNLKN